MPDPETFEEFAEYARMSAAVPPEERVQLYGFEAMGHPIPSHRMSAAYDAVKEMIPGISTEDAMTLVGRVARHIEDDKPYEALRVATGAPLPIDPSSPQGSYTPEPGVRLDVTGGYRLLATLCSG